MQLSLFIIIIIIIIIILYARYGTIVGNFFLSREYVNLRVCGLSK